MHHASVHLVAEVQASVHEEGESCVLGVGSAVHKCAELSASRIARICFSSIGVGIDKWRRLCGRERAADFDHRAQVVVIEAMRVTL